MRKNIILLISIILLCVLSVIPLGNCAHVYYDSNVFTGATQSNTRLWNVYDGDNSAVGQSFTSNTTGYIHEITVKIGKYGSPTGYIQLAVATVGGNYSESPYPVNVFSYSNLINVANVFGANYVVFELQTDCPVEANGQYFFYIYMVSGTCNATNYIQVYAGDSSGHSGHFAYYVDNDWETGDFDFDLPYQIIGDSVPNVEPTPTPTPAPYPAPHVYVIGEGTATSNTTSYSEGCDFTLTMAPSAGWNYTQVTRFGYTATTNSTDNPYTCSNYTAGEFFFVYFEDLSDGFVNPRFYVTGEGAYTVNSTDRYLGVPLELTFIPSDGWEFDYIFSYTNLTNHITDNPYVINSLASGAVYGIVFVETNPSGTPTPTPAPTTAIQGVLTILLDSSIIGLFIVLICAVVGAWAAGLIGFVAGSIVGGIFTYLGGIFPLWGLVALIFVDAAILFYGRKSDSDNNLG